MPWYDGNIPTNWKSALERYNGAEFVTEVIFDPEGDNVLLTDSHDVIDVSPISIKKELDPEFGITPTVNNISITFNDPDNYFNPDNSNGIFYNYTPVGKSIIIRLKNVTASTIQTITVFSGRIDRLPILRLGFSTLVCSDRRKYILNQKITGADSDSAKKLMTMNSAGGLVSSVTYSNTWNASPYDFELTGGALPTGLALSSTGTISGTPTESGDFSFTVKVTNASGEYHSIDCDLYVDPNINNHFLSALGLGDYTEVINSAGPVFSLAARESYCRCTLNGVFDWDTDDNKAPHLKYDNATGLSGAWVAIGRVDHVGLNGANATYTGIYVRRGDYKGNLCAVEYRTTGATYAASLYRADDNSNRARANIAQSYAWVKINKSGTTYDFYYRTAESGAWTLLKTDTQTETPTEVGFMVMNDLTGNGYGEIDQFWFYSGTLAISTSASLPTAAKDSAYSTFIKSTGGAGEYTYAVTSGALPDGLALNTSTGEISGTPTNAQSSTFTITVTDGAAGTDDQEFVLTVSEDVYILPSVLPDATYNTAYSEDFDIYGDGTFDRTAVTIGTRCDLGKWTITFKNSTDFDIVGPGISNTTGATDTALTITNVITIPTTAWSGNFRADDYVEFITGKSYESTNAASLIYDIYTDFGIDNKFLDCSSFFGNKEIGKIYEDVAAAGTSLKIAVDVPTIIKAGETLTLTYGASTENITVNTGNTSSTSFPPYITLTVSPLVSGFSANSTVTWVQRGTKDIDYSFDEFWNYCNENNFNLSLTFDRTINALEAIELVGIHAGIYAMHSRGVERLAGLIERWTETLTEFTESRILAGSVEVDAMEVFNSFTANFAYDYLNQEFTKVYTYPATDAGNASYTKHRYKREKILDLPGYYSEATVTTLLTNLYNVFNDGLRLVNYECDLRSVLALIGERYDVNFNYPDIDTEVEIYGYTLNVLNKYSIVLNTVDRAHLTNVGSPFLEMPDGTPIQMPKTGKKIRMPKKW